MNSTSPESPSGQKPPSRSRVTRDSSGRARSRRSPTPSFARQTRPEDPGRPADTRVLRVKLALLEPHRLKLGQHVEVEILRDAAD